MWKAIVVALLTAAAPELVVRVVDYEPTIAADGRIAFISNRDGFFRLYTMDADGRNIARLTDDTGVEDSPAWSPDGRLIAYVSERDGNSDIFVVGADGGEPRRVTTHAGPDIHPTWSPDGRRLLFNSLRRASSPNHIDIWEIGLDGGEERRITRNVSASYASWSPRGDVILVRAMFGENSDIALMSARGRILLRLTDDSAFDGWPSWSPDGAYIVFARERGDEADIYVMAADGSDERLVVTGPGRKTNPRWASGGHIVYSRRLEGETRLWRVRAP